MAILSIVSPICIVGIMCMIETEIIEAVISGLVLGCMVGSVFSIIFWVTNKYKNKILRIISLIPLVFVGLYSLLFILYLAYKQISANFSFLSNFYIQFVLLRSIPIYNKTIIFCFFQDLFVYFKLIISRLSITIFSPLRSNQKIFILSNIQTYRNKTVRKKGVPQRAHLNLSFQNGSPVLFIIQNTDNMYNLFKFIVNVENIVITIPSHTKSQSCQNRV